MYKKQSQWKIVQIYSQSKIKRIIKTHTCVFHPFQTCHSVDKHRMTSSGLIIYEEKIIQSKSYPDHLTLSRIHLYIHLFMECILSFIIGISGFVCEK